MGFAGFASWFAGGILITASLQVLFKNVFITAFITGLIIGVLGAKD